MEIQWYYEAIEWKIGLSIHTFLPGGPSASLDLIWERGAGSTGLVCSPIPPNCWKLWLCSSTTGTQPKKAGRRPPTKTQAVFDFPLTSSPSVWRLLSQSRQFLLSSKANQALSVPAPALFSHPPPLPELGFWNSTAKNWLLQFSLSLFPQAKNGTAVADELKRRGVVENKKRLIFQKYYLAITLTILILK